MLKKTAYGKYSEWFESSPLPHGSHPLLILLKCSSKVCYPLPLCLTLLETVKV